jgi:hypothetical protein
MRTENLLLVLNVTCIIALVRDVLRYAIVGYSAAYSLIHLIQQLRSLVHFLYGHLMPLKRLLDALYRLTLSLD